MSLPTSGRTLYSDDIMSSLPTWFLQVNSIFAQAGVPFSVWASIAWEESSFNPNASNTKPPDDSWGLFALNRAGGQGAGHSTAELQDPILNAQIAVRSIAPAYHATPNDIQQIAIASGHPGTTAPRSNPLVQRIARTYAVISALNPIDAVANLLGGLKLPDILPAIPSLDPGKIGTGLVDAATGAWHAWIKGVTAKSRDELIDYLGVPVTFFVGVNLLGFGLLLAALQSAPGQAAADTAIAAGPGPVKAGGAAVKLVGAGQTRPATRVMRERQGAQQKALDGAQPSTAAPRRSRIVRATARRAASPNRGVQRRAATRTP